MASAFSYNIIKSTLFVFLSYIDPMSMLTLTSRLFFKTTMEIDNKISNVGFLSHMTADSLLVCAMRCYDNCKCVGYNKEKNQCRLHSQIHCFDNFTADITEERWEYFCERGCCAGTSTIHFLDAYVPSDTNLYIANTTESRVGETTNYTCPPKTVSVGRNQITCLETGKWSTAMCEECTEADDPKQINYRGKKNVTTTKKTCQRWDARTPHIPNNYNFPGNDENYCRNPDDHSGSWCYTTDPNTRWEDCDVPRC
ncbi:hepatocyte growth factor-like [Saccostrea cucullata]|uniref:hepatocyte growth factor-like n=1 Tax=Saccostrea cuccullata TaxID=36930 RepID=UPI002ED46E4E